MKQPITPPLVLPLDQSRAEAVSDAVVHLIGLAVAIVAAPVLIAFAVFWHGETRAIVAVSVYAAALILMILASAAYNASRSARWKPTLRKLDHTAIYFKIAATYTPLVALTGGVGSGLLAALWATAVGGAGLKFLSPDRMKWVGLALYLGMGWVGVVAGQDLIAELSPAARALLITGGLLYTFGVPFYLWDRLRFNRAIWHGFVMVASFTLYAAILAQVAQGPRLAALAPSLIAPL
ncbi:PAQR family membrane homeostasis protein TrhA [Anianabacter salinae]|uniref:PAQR family membrane homeostasis protein TrhA n=1 Tax=Anianabacter salinae TaxID=2851023 RepID=UPI00225DEFE4|nr:hemolysin III family protein [Anianabacter salinae]MBV0910791.1 hemolysin III family protein [Anianabacter salinae]